MIIEYLGKKARTVLKFKLVKISNIAIKTKNIKGYVEPKNIEIEFLQGNIPEKVKAISDVKKILADFRLYQFNNNL